MPELTPQQRTAFENVRDMLGTNGLGGADRTFNYADVAAVRSALRQDTRGMVEQVRAQEDGLRERVAVRTLTEGVRGGPIRRAIRGQALQQINSQFNAQVTQQLTQGLASQNINPATGAVQDMTPRNITIAQMRQFEANAKVLQAFGDANAQRTGFRMEFPNGITQSSMEDILAGRIPSGGRLVAVPRTQTPVAGNSGQPAQPVAQPTVTQPQPVRSAPVAQPTVISSGSVQNEPIPVQTQPQQFFIQPQRQRRGLFGRRR